MEYYVWLIITAILFTFVGAFMAWDTAYKMVARATVELLIREGYLKTVTKPDGSIDIRKITE